jgi:hypothetical protein
MSEIFPFWLAVIIPFLIVWTLPWKGVALWRAARNKQLVWFIVLLVVNTLAILEIIYIFGFSKKKSEQSTLSTPSP